MIPVIATMNSAMNFFFICNVQTAQLKKLSV